MKNKEIPKIRRKWAINPKTRVKDSKKKYSRVCEKYKQRKILEQELKNMSNDDSNKLKKLRIGIPKGSLQEKTFKMFQKAGFEIYLTPRSYFPSIDDPELEPVLLRAQEIPKYVEDGALDCGITGNDWIIESEARVIKIKDLVYAKQRLIPVRWVLAVPVDSGINNIKQLDGRRIATELVNITRKYLKKKKVNAEVEFSWGATEAKVGANLVDAIVELTETGTSLMANKLKILDTVCKSTTYFIANKTSWKDSWKKAKMKALSLLIEGAVQAEAKVGLKMNVSSKNLDRIISILPAMRKPTISRLSEKGWVAVETIIDERVVKNLIPKLKELGAEGIIEYPLNKVIY